MDGLRYPVSLSDWSHWQQTNQPWTRRLKGRVLSLRSAGRPEAARMATLTLGGPEPKLVVCLETRGPTATAALLAPLRALNPQDLAVIAWEPVKDLLPDADWTETTGAADILLDGVVTPETVVLSTGHYLPLGALAYQRSAHRRFVTVQHGLLTPFAPPLAPGTTLLAWSAADGDFWRGDRADVSTTVVGSQLIWEAEALPRVEPNPAAGKVFLGQLHGAELPRHQLARAAEELCRAEGAAYRPHPSERDRRSRATHARWERAGIRIDRSGRPLRELGAGVVSVFSTGVLEAAAAGLDGWVFLPDPPPWVEEFWTRYGLSRWGGPATPPPIRPEIEPSRAIGALVQEMMDA